MSESNHNNQNPKMEAPAANIVVPSAQDDGSKGDSGGYGGDGDGGIEATMAQIAAGATKTAAVPPPTWLKREHEVAVQDAAS